ncbi:Coenzyme F420:L-glutamate ligase [compost metagenome]
MSIKAEKPVIGILGGSGHEGSGLALRWARAGYQVLLGSRTAERAAEAAARLNARLGGSTIVGMANDAAAARADIVVMTVPFSAQISTAERVKTFLEGKIFVDVTVPLVPPKVARVQLPTSGSAVAALQQMLGEKVKVVSAFQNISAHLLADADKPIDCDVLVCGDDKHARDVVIGLAAAAGMRAFHGGPIANSAAAEALTSVLISLNQQHKVNAAGIQITGVPHAAASDPAVARRTAGTMPPACLTLMPLTAVPMVQAGDNLADIVLRALDASEQVLRAGDVLVFAQKIVSKAQGRVVQLDTVVPSAQAEALAAEVGKDPRLVQLILSESSAVVRHRPGVLIAAHRLGCVMANAGIDMSNVGSTGDDLALLLPQDPDAWCTQMRGELLAITGVDVAVLVIDSFGRAWRNGTVGTAIGVSGMPGLVDLRGRPDLFGRVLRESEVGLADELAAAASLVMGQADEALPIVLARGVPYERRNGSARELVRPESADMFR